MAAAVVAAVAERETWQWGWWRRCLIREKALVEVVAAAAGAVAAAAEQPSARLAPTATHCGFECESQEDPPWSIKLKKVFRIVDGKNRRDNRNNTKRCGPAKVSTWYLVLRYSYQACSTTVVSGETAYLWTSTDVYV